MANSILISTDMKYVYIIDSNDKVIFSNSLSGDGVIIRLNSSDELQGAAATSTFSGAPVTKSVTNAQWTLTYSSATKKLWIIGVTDEVVGLTDGEGFPLDIRDVQIKLTGTDLILKTS